MKSSSVRTGSSYTRAFAELGAKYRRDKLFKITVSLLLVAGGLLILLPFLFMVSISLDKNAVVTVPFPPELIPSNMTFDSFKQAFTLAKMPRLYVNTLQVATGVIILSLISALFSGYALSKLRMRGGKFILFLALSTMMIPMEATIIPMFLLLRKMDLLNSYWAFYLPAISYPFGTFLVKQYIDGLPDELREAAIIDGASEVRTFVSIYLPLCKSLVATLVVLLFLTIWNSFLWPLIVLTDMSKYTIQLGIAILKTSSIASAGAEGYGLPSLNMAATVLSVIPVLIVFIIFQRHIVESVAQSGIKG